MANVLAPLVILAGLGAALALAGPGGSVKAPGDGQLEPGIAVRISAPDPKRTLAGTLYRGDSPLHPAIAAALGRTWSAIERDGVDPGRELLAPLSLLEISVEQSCPPPALLGCGPAVRLTGLLEAPPPPGFERAVGASLASALRATGARALVVRGAASGEGSGRVTSHGETLVRWRRSGDLVEVVTAGLELRPEDAQDTDPASAPVDRDATATPEVRIETDPVTLAALLR